jgi:hypothetical protein
VRTFQLESVELSTFIVQTEVSYDMAGESRVGLSVALIVIAMGGVCHVCLGHMSVSTNHCKHRAVTQLQV